LVQRWRWLGEFRSERQCCIMEGQRVATRLMGDLGRIVIPADMREALGWGIGKELEVVMNNLATRSIVIREVLLRCSLYQVESENLRKVEKGYVCSGCAAKIK